MWHFAQLTHIQPPPPFISCSFLSICFNWLSVNIKLMIFLLLSQNLKCDWTLHIYTTIITRSQISCNPDILFRHEKKQTNLKNSESKGDKMCRLYCEWGLHCILLLLTSVAQLVYQFVLLFSAAPDWAVELLFGPLPQRICLLLGFLQCTWHPATQRREMQ